VKRERPAAPEGGAGRLRSVASARGEQSAILRVSHNANVATRRERALRPFHVVPMNTFWKWFFTSEMSFDLHSNPIKAPPILMLLLLILVIVSCIWAARDAQRRGRSAVGAVFFVLMALWPVSLLWWLWLRPPIYRTSPPPLP